MEVKIKDKDGYVEADWTIEDGILVVSPKKVKFEPKDGDVLYVNSGYDNIIIFKESNNNSIGRYVNLSDNHILYTDDNYVCDKECVKEIRPAAEEEKQKLFDKLKEEGYEWKPDTKELVKLKWKPKEGEEFWLPLYYTYPSDFKPITSLLNKGRDKVILDKGWVFKTEEECQEFCNRLNDTINSVKP